MIIGIKSLVEKIGGVSFKFIKSFVVCFSISFLLFADFQLNISSFESVRPAGVNPLDRDLTTAH